MIYIKKNYTQPFSLKELSDAIGKNAYYILRIFKEINGVTPLQYLHLLRISKAQKLLIETNMSVTNIAFDVGYNDSTQFSINFKKYTGLTPSEFRVNLTDS
ncbi:AraC family transcriptional regulator [Shouchella sp. 1P09AA]|uniref:helix-turn-helix transcriptional regulator n=1 Tax=unclassified Shouchella TaxID=2893065 RepID=UPI0039A19FA7